MKHGKDPAYSEESLATRKERLTGKFTDFLESDPESHQCVIKLAGFLREFEGYMKADSLSPDGSGVRYLAYDTKTPTNAAKHLTRCAREVLNDAPHRGPYQMIADGLTEALALAELDGEA